MNNHLLRIDVSDLKYKKSEDDLIKIKLNNNDIIQVNFSKLVSQSNYIRDKYKYSEVLNIIQSEIDKLSKEMKIKDESIKLFIELIQQEKVNFPIEYYKDFYALSEYFDIPKFIHELDNISKQELYKDLNFTIQILHESEAENNEFETNLSSKIEDFLSTRINECFDNEKFGKFSISTIFRIVDKSDKEDINQNFLVDFILKSVDTRYILFKFIELHKLSDDKIDEFIQIIDEKQEKLNKNYLEYMQFNFSFIIPFIRQMKNKYNKLSIVLDQTREEHEQTKQELNQKIEDNEQTKLILNQTIEENEQTKLILNQTIEEHEQTKLKLNQTAEELEQIKLKLDQTIEKHEQAKQELNQTIGENEQTKLKLNQTVEEFEQVKLKLDQKIEENKQTQLKLDQIVEENEQTKQELNQIKSEIINYSQSLIVAGYDKYSQLGRKPNNRNAVGNPIISPPMIFPFKFSSVLSYSFYHSHSVVVMNNSSLHGIGYNNDGRISSSLTKTEISQFTEFSIKDDSGKQLTPISAVCSRFGTFYLFAKSKSPSRQLAYCHMNGEKPVFIDIGNYEPVALFGGCDHAASITSEGEIIFINNGSVKKSPESSFKAIHLPDGEKASSVGCCVSTVIALSVNGRVFSSPIRKGSSALKFSVVEELKDEKIVCVSGTHTHFLVVSQEGHVFGRGSNENGQLGLNKEIKSAQTFTKILSLEEYKIKAAYAGYSHSLFETQEGQILSCGSNESGQLLLSIGPGENVYSPTETTITSGATFCIAGNKISAVFIGIDPPQNMPNRRIQPHQ